MFWWKLDYNGATFKPQCPPQKILNNLQNREKILYFWKRKKKKKEGPQKGLCAMLWRDEWLHFLGVDSVHRLPRLWKQNSEWGSWNMERADIAVQKNISLVQSHSLQLESWNQLIAQTDQIRRKVKITQRFQAINGGEKNKSFNCLEIIWILEIWPLG